MRKISLLFVVVTLFLTSFTSGFSVTVKDSITQDLHRYEKIENIDRKKVSKKQYEDIEKALLRSDEKIRVVTYNMLFNIKDSRLPECHRWPERLPRLVSLINEMQPDVIATQELFADQVQDLLDRIGDTYAFFGVPSINLNNGEQLEIDGILFRKDRFDLMEKEGVYMSLDPEKVTSDPYSSFARVLTMVRLKDKRTDKEFYVLNTHTSFSSPDSREFTLQFIADFIQPIRKKYPLFVTGDWNTFPSHLSDDTLPFYDGTYLLNVLRKAGLYDSKDEALIGVLGPLSTFTNEPGDKVAFMGTGTPGLFLDHVYVNSRVNVLLQGVQPAKVDGHFPSDHMPVVVDAILD